MTRRKEVDRGIEFRGFSRSQVERSLQVPVVATLGGVFAGPGALGEGTVRRNGPAVTQEDGFVLFEVTIDEGDQLGARPRLS